MKTWITLAVVCLSLNARAADSIEAMPGMPGRSNSTEEMQLIQNSPAMEANALLAPVTNATTETPLKQAPAFEANSINAPLETEAYVPPTVFGSTQFRAPGAGSTLAEISISNATGTARSFNYYSEGTWGPTYSETGFDANFYSFRFSHGLTDRSMLFVDAGFMKTKTDNSVLAPSMNRQGVRDFEFGYLGRSANVRRTWLYGGSIAGSPESFKTYSNSSTFTGLTTLRAHVGYERRFSKSTGGIDVALVNEVGSMKNDFYDARFRASTGYYFDTLAYFEYPIAPKVGFGVEGGIANDGVLFFQKNSAYRAAAYSTIDIMEDAQFKIKAEGSTTANEYSDTSGSTTRITGVLSKAL